MMRPRHGTGQREAAPGPLDAAIPDAAGPGAEASEPVRPDPAPHRDGNPVPPAQVAGMFDDIAPVYDRMNTVMTGGADGRWRRAAVEATALRPGDAVVDVACGTGKLSAALGERVGPFGRVVGVDLSVRMLAEARAAWPDLVQVSFVEGDALALPFADGEFDAATIAFGLRNLPDFEGGFQELARVVRPGGRVVCLELTTPRPRWWGRLFLATFRRVAPVLGTLAGARDAYHYLPSSLDGFPDADALAGSMRAVGLRGVRYRRMGLRSVAVHVGVVAERPAG
jgi:demethylmenaquinone methyltransferase/2-methoxy-6-polyprenyl-1,4-benzoquinol methylase